MRKQIWMGTRQYSTWVPAPSIDMASSKVGWATKMQYKGGGAAVRRSTAAHREYQMAWNLLPRDEARKITDFADRLHGDGLIYWLDPFAADKNLLPQFWASPVQGLDDGIPLVENGRVRGTAVTTEVNGLGYPSTSVRYNVKEDSFLPEIYVPIPLGHTAWIGARGVEGTGGKLTYAAGRGESVSDFTNVTFLGVNDVTRFNASIDSLNGTNTGVVLKFGGSGTVTVTGIMVQVLPTGRTPAPGGFISGQGNSGCEFADQPEVSQYSAALDQVGVTATLVETGAWKR